MGGAAENMGSLPPQCAPRARHGELDGFERQSQLRIWRQRNLDGGWRRTLLEGPRTGCSFIFPAARTSTLESCSSILLPLHWLREALGAEAPELQPSASAMTGTELFSSVALG
ncbi:uncharacterized protein LOC132662076 [Panthera onca]